MMAKLFPNRRHITIKRALIRDGRGDVIRVVRFNLATCDYLIYTKLNIDI